MTSYTPLQTDSHRLEHPPLFQQFPTRLATLIAPTDMRATEAQLKAFREFAHKGDPLADALVEEMRNNPAGRKNFEVALERGLNTVDNPSPALKAFFNAVESIPYWVDPEKLQLGAHTIQRTGLLGAYGALVDVSLMGGYLSFRALKVLVQTGEIDSKAPRRIAETALWWMAVTEDGGLDRFATGFKNTLRVRLVHAQIRAGMARRTDWDFDAWDAPINQPQMAGTQLLFSLVGLLGLRVMGFRFTDEEVDAVTQLWRYVGLLMGVDEALLPANETDAWRLLWLVATTEFQPDDDSRKLAGALCKALPPLHGIHGDGPASRLAAWAVTGYHSTLSRLVFGNPNGDALGLPRQPLFILPAVAAAATTFTLETLRRNIPGATALSVRFGRTTRRMALERLAPPLKPNLSYTRE